MSRQTIFSVTAIALLTALGATAALGQKAYRTGSGAGGVVIELVPTGSTESFTIQGNRLVIPAGGVQVEFEVFISGWGQAAGAPTLGGYQATVLASSLLGENSSPPNLGVDLMPPSPNTCESAVDCPAPLPPPVTASGGCGTFVVWNGGPDPSCDDFEPAFITERVCSNDSTTPCAQSADCPSSSSCVANADFVFSGLGSVFASAGRTVSDGILWLALALLEAKQDDGASKYYAGSLRLIVPATAVGTYTIRFSRDSELTFLNDANNTGIAGLTFIDGELTVGGVCCMPNDDCASLEPDACVDAGGTPRPGTCDRDDNDNGIPDACESCPGEGDCCAANGTPGCRDGSCCQAVCALDPSCCDLIWDDACAELALLNCSPDVVCIGDSDGDGLVGQLDWSFLFRCLQGPGVTPDVMPPPPTLSECLQYLDTDGDGDVDIFDVGRFGIVFTGNP